MKDRLLALSLAKTKVWAGAFVFSLGLFAVGCGGGEGTVSGKVLYQGKPLPGGSVSFFPSGGPPVTGRIKPDGSYSVLKVPPGPAKIAIVLPSASSSSRKLPPGMAQALKSGKMKLSEEAKAKMPAEQKKALESLSSPQEKSVSIPTKYGDPEKSGLEFTVTGGSQSHDIELQ